MEVLRPCRGAFAFGKSIGRFRQHQDPVERMELRMMIEAAGGKPVSATQMVTVSLLTRLCGHLARKRYYKPCVEYHDSQ